MRMMDNNILLQELKSKFTKSILSIDEDADIMTITITSETIKQLITYLKDKQNFIFLTDLCGIHYPEQEKELGVIYHLHNLVANKRIRLKTFVTKANPQIESIVSLFSAANWMERETFDFYGIDFVGHPNLIRILNVEYMDYYPMRKEYPLEDATRSDKDDSFFGR
jgi:NADH-quinone oxidoreductase subunit C